MTPNNQLTIEGNLHEHPFAEVVAEISHASLTGSLRISNDDRKVVIYFKKGRLQFAVSNARSSRLFDMLIKRGRMAANDLASIPNFANDLEFANFLEDTGFFTRHDRDLLFVDQIEAILTDVLSWPAGQWSFSALARLRDGLEFDVDVGRLLLEYARCLSPATVMERFRTIKDSFARVESPDLGLVLSSDEMSVLGLFLDHKMSLEEIFSLAAGRSPQMVMSSLYALWLSGVLERHDWHPAFTKVTIAAINAAKLELRAEAKVKTAAPAAVPVEAKSGKAENDKETLPDVTIDLEDYLKRVEAADTYYDVLGIELSATIPQIKHAYFGLARVFHPDHFHKEEGTVRRRVQDCFTELAKAYETLKTNESRDLYDFKMRNELAEKKKKKETGTYDELSRQLQQAIDSFERGFSLLMEEKYDAALPFLARAAHFDPKNARFHAYYGKALSVDEKQRHKAESEMQTALRLDPQNPTFRIMLAEFFIQMNLLKRAEGELNRLLAIFPSNREAQNLLAGLKSK